MSYNEIKIKTYEKQVFINDQIIAFTRKEYELILYFMIKKSNVFSEEPIVEHFGGDYVILSDSLDFVYTQIRNLRRKPTAIDCKIYIKNISKF